MCNEHGCKYEDLINSEEAAKYLGISMSVMEYIETRLEQPPCECVIGAMAGWKKDRLYKIQNLEKWQPQGNRSKWLAGMTDLAKPRKATVVDSMVDSIELTVRHYAPAIIMIIIFFIVISN